MLPTSSNKKDRDDDGKNSGHRKMRQKSRTSNNSLSSKKVLQLTAIGVIIVLGLSSFRPTRKVMTTTITTGKKTIVRNRENVKSTRHAPWEITTRYNSSTGQNVTYYGRYDFQNKGRLVVSADQSVMFWNGGQSDLCKILRKMTDVQHLGITNDDYDDDDDKNKNNNTNNSGEEEHGNDDDDDGMPRPLLNITVDCFKLHQQQFMGQENWIIALYGARMAAALAQVDFNFQCTHGHNSQMSLLLPWFGGFQKSSTELDPWPHGPSMPTESEACTNKYSELRIDKMVDQIVDDARKMAIMLVGSRPDQRRVHPNIPIDQPPLIPNVQFDDVVIHFRCGDGMGGDTSRNGFDMIKFNSYKQYINRTATKSIGIITQSFDEPLNRQKDSMHADKCHTAVQLLVDYLYDFLGNDDLPITVHNGENETLPLACARLVMAKQAFTSSTSSSIFPVLGTFGQGYLQEGNFDFYPFVKYIPSHLSNIHTLSTPIDDVYDWFVTSSDDPRKAVDFHEQGMKRRYWHITTTMKQRTYYGYYDENNDGRLVVNIDHVVMFWRRGQNDLCEILRNMTNTDTLGTTPSSLTPRPLLNATIDCLWLKADEDFGHGNWITAIYDARMAAALAQVDFMFQCADGRESQMSLLLPWFDGLQKALIELDPWPFGQSKPTEDEACTLNYGQLRIDKMIDMIVDDTRKLAVTIVGSQENPLRVHPDVPRDQPPLIPNVHLDDVVIHFRCGDIMGIHRDDFGLIKFSIYKRINRNETKSIGIVTQPFETSLNRIRDGDQVDRCRTVVYGLVNYLRRNVVDKNVPITIHNGANETLPLAYARLVMAKQAFTSLSSFGIFPVLGTFGQGYFQKGNYGVNKFANNLSPSYKPNIHMMNANTLKSRALSRMQANHIVRWLASG